MSNIEQVQDIYAAFGRGDVPTILGKLSENIQWEYGVNSTNVPWLQPRKGRSEVTKFFEALSAIEILRFQPKTFFENGNIVVVLIDLEATVKATGKRVIEEDEVHIWYFDDRGQAIRFRHRVDTHQQAMAFRG